MTTMDDLVARLGACDEFWINKPIGFTSLTGHVASYWGSPGYPVPGATPTTTAAICTKATQGAIPFTDASSGYCRALVTNLVGFTRGQDVEWHDRIWHVGGFDSTSTSVQTINSPVLPSDRLIATDLSDLDYWLDVQTALGSTDRNITVTYTGTDNATHTVSSAIGVSRGPGTLRPIHSAAGSIIKSIQSMVLDGSTGTPGSYGIVCTRKLAARVVAFDNGSTTPSRIGVADWASLGLIAIPNNACIMPIGKCVNATTAVGFEATLLIGAL